MLRLVVDWKTMPAKLVPRLNLGKGIKLSNLGGTKTRPKRERKQVKI